MNVINTSYSRRWNDNLKQEYLGMFEITDGTSNDDRVIEILEFLDRNEIWHARILIFHILIENDDECYSGIHPEWTKLRNPNSDEFFLRFWRYVLLDVDNTKLIFKPHDRLEVLKTVCQKRHRKTALFLMSNYGIRLVIDFLYIGIPPSNRDRWFYGLISDFLKDLNQVMKNWFLFEIIRNDSVYISNEDSDTDDSDNEDSDTDEFDRDILEMFLNSGADPFDRNNYKKKNCFEILNEEEDAALIDFLNRDRQIEGV